jgi:hypothetical protein
MELQEIAKWRPIANQNQELNLSIRMYLNYEASPIE